MQKKSKHDKEVFESGRGIRPGSVVDGKRQGGNSVVINYPVGHGK